MAPNTIPGAKHSLSLFLALDLQTHKHKHTSVTCAVHSLVQPERLSSLFECRFLLGTSHAAQVRIARHMLTQDFRNIVIHPPPPAPSMRSTLPAPLYPLMVLSLRQGEAVRVSRPRPSQRWAWADPNRPGWNAGSEGQGDSPKEGVRPVVIGNASDEVRTDASESQPHAGTRAHGRTQGALLATLARMRGAC